MKSVLMSIRPKWCELIASGKKTVEVRKSRPKLETPFKVYIYETKDKKFENIGIHWEDGKTFEHNIGKVIGEFVCDKVTMSFVGYDEKGCPSYWDIFDGSCLTANELVCYGQFKTLYGWHISDLVIYDNPKSLGEFFKACDKPKGTDCSVCVDHRENRCKAITRPPQSWCYVEEVNGND